MHLPVGLLPRLRQRLNEIVPVSIVQEDAIAAIASAHYVIHHSGVLDTQLARHVSLIDLLGTEVNGKTLTGIMNQNMG